MAVRDPARRSMPRHEWPKEDDLLWARALGPRDLLDSSEGYARRWADKTIQGVEKGYGRFLGFLAFSGELEGDVAGGPAARVTPDRVLRYISALRAQKNAEYSVALRVQQISQFLRATEPSADASWVMLIASRIHTEARPVRNTIARMQPAEAVIALGEALMEMAEADVLRPDVDRAKLFRDGLLITFMVYRPDRRRNLTAMALGKHLEKRGDHWVVRVPPDETKGGKLLESTWPADLESALERYLAVHRPLLAARGGAGKRPTDALWVSQLGRGLTGSAIYAQVRKRTLAGFGVAMNPHVFRSVTATAIATHSPEHINDVVDILGHSSLKTSEGHYNRARMLSASVSYQSALRRRRKLKCRLT
jgi:integrase/recombinase XerD